MNGKVMTIEELCSEIARIEAENGWMPSDARTAQSVTPRLVRHWATQGWIDKPVRDGRNSMYDGRHLAQACAIRKSQMDGLGSKAVGTMLTTSPSISVSDLSAFYSSPPPAAHYGASSSTPPVSASGGHLPQVGLAAALSALDDISMRVGLQPPSPSMTGVVAPLYLSAAASRGVAKHSRTPGHMRASPVGGVSIGGVSIIWGDPSAIPADDASLSEMLRLARDAMIEARKSHTRPGTGGASVVGRSS